MAKSKQKLAKELGQKIKNAVTGVNCDCVDDVEEVTDDYEIIDDGEKKTTVKSRQDSKTPAAAGGVTYNVYNDYSGATFTFNVERVDNFNVSDPTGKLGGGIINSAPQLGGATGGKALPQGAIPQSHSPSQPQSQTYGVICDGQFLTAEQITPNMALPNGGDAFLAVREMKNGRVWAHPVEKAAVPEAQLADIKRACAYYNLRVLAQS